jgi:hypothetical protein
MAPAKAAASSARAPRPVSNRKSPPPRASAQNRRFLKVLSPAECFDLLEPGGIGRVGITDAEGVIILPVNYAVKDQAIIYRTAPDTKSASKWTNATKSCMKAGAFWYTVTRTRSLMSIR